MIVLLLLYTAAVLTAVVKRIVLLPPILPTPLPPLRNKPLWCNLYPYTGRSTRSVTVAATVVYFWMSNAVGAPHRLER